MCRRTHRGRCRTRRPARCRTSWCSRSDWRPRLRHRFAAACRCRRSAGRHTRHRSGRTLPPSWRTCPGRTGLPRTCSRPRRRSFPPPDSLRTTACRRSRRSHFRTPPRCRHSSPARNRIGLPPRPLRTSAPARIARNPACCCTRPIPSRTKPKAVHKSSACTLTFRTCLARRHRTLVRSRNHHTSLSLRSHPALSHTARRAASMSLLHSRCLCRCPPMTPHHWKRRPRQRSRPRHHPRPSRTAAPRRCPLGSSRTKEPQARGLQRPQTSVHGSVPP